VRNLIRGVDAVERVRGQVARSGIERGPFGFLAGAAAVAGAFVLAGLGIAHWQTWQAESFGDRRLGTPSAAECQIARAVLADSRDHDRLALLRSVGAADQPMGFRAFAWRSSGVRTPGRGADWRACPGLGRDIRGLGMARFASGELGPMLYVSRATVDGDRAQVFETFYPPERLGQADVEQRLSGAMRSWDLRLQRRAADGGWTIVGRSAAATPS
jgi:hypothetical protein